MIIPFSLSEFSKSFMKNDILSIDIGFTNIKVVHVRKKTGSLLKIINYGIGSTPFGCIKNGIISDLEGIANNLKKVIEEQGINERNVKIVISAGSNIISKVIYVSKVDDKKVEEKIKEEIRKQIPVDIQSQKLFYRITGETLSNKLHYFKVLITVVPNSTIDTYVKLLKLLNFKPVSIEIPFSSIARFFSKGVSVAEREEWNHLKTPFDMDKGTIAVIDLGSETTNLSIMNNGALEFNRIVLAGGRNLDELISKKLGVTREVAERYKKMHGISFEMHMGDEIEKIVDECMRDYLGEILRNIKRSLDFYVNRCSGHKVERIVFIGGGSGIRGLRQFSYEIMETQVYTIEMLEFKNIEFESNLDKEKIRYLVNALGIAM